MTPSPLNRRLRLGVAGLTAVVVAITLVVVLPTASADPRLDRVRSQLEEVSEQVESLYLAAEQANQEWLAASERRDEAEDELASAHRDVEAQKQKVDDAVSSVSTFAAALYRDNVGDPVLTLVLGGDDLSGALAETTQLEAYTARQTDLLAQVAHERDLLVAKESDVQEQMDLIALIEDEMAGHKAEIDRNLDEVQALESTLQDEEQDILALIEAEREAERQAAAAREARLAASRDEERDDVQAQPATTQQEPEAGDQAAPAQTTTGPGASDEQQTETEPPPAPEPPPPPPSSGRGATAAAFAMSQIGDYYAYGGTGPDGWDCSGLTSGSWAAAGLAIPRTSQGQFYGLPRVPMDALQPGDIIGYYSGVSHVGIYIGNGQIVHASRPGRPVGITSVYTMPVMGAVRPG